MCAHVGSLEGQSDVVVQLVYLKKHVFTHSDEEVRAQVMVCLESRAHGHWTKANWQVCLLHCICGASLVATVHGSLG